MVSTLEEMLINRFLDIAFRGIPGTLIILLSYVDNTSETGLAALLTLLCSAGATAFLTTTLTFEFDVDYEKRKESPKVRG